jgi:hypothetical protein
MVRAPRALLLKSFSAELLAFSQQTTINGGKVSFFRRSHVAPELHALTGIGDDTPLALRIAQAIAWCEPRFDARAIAASLRSDQLRPRVLETDRATIVHHVVHQRTVDNAVRAAIPARTRADLRGGRLLVYFPDFELADGAAEAETSGFFDVNDAPPWDTWVSLCSDPELTGHGLAAVYLVSWVPPALVASVQRGIDVGMTGCIAWLEETNTGLATCLSGTLGAEQRR